MPLSTGRIHRGRPTPFPWEREALDHIYAYVSDNDPHQAWELHELYDRFSGRLYEVDLVFLSRAGLFLVEIKSDPGVLRGDMVDWTYTDEAGRRKVKPCPYPDANHKAKILASLLEKELPGERPWVQAVVFLSNVTRVELEGGRPPWLLLREDVVPKLVNGLDAAPKKVVNRPMMKQLVQVANRLGLRPNQSSRVVGGYELGALVDEGEGYQEHLAKNAAVDKDRARIRSYLVPAATSTTRRDQLQRAARREARTLAELGQHPGILGYRSFLEDAPLGPALVFEAFEDGHPLDAFLRQHPDLTFDERLNLLQQIVEAVAHCHRAGVMHRNLGPASVLVRRTAEGKLQVRLHRFQTASSLEHSSFGTKHLADFARNVDRLYQAPEVLADPNQARPESDLFSIGCLAWLLFTGQHPGTDLVDRERRLRSVGGEGLRPSSVRGDLAVLDEALAFATHPNLYERVDHVSEWFDVWVVDALTRPPSPEPGIDPLEADKGMELPGGLKVIRRLGTGGTALVLHVRREGRDFALKVPHDEGCAERLLAEAKVLRELRHQHIVEFRELLTLGGRPCLLLQFAGEQTLGELLQKEGALSLELAKRFGDDLLSAVQYLEETGVTHRDIKPGNVGFTSQAKKKQHLLLLDFSLAGADETATHAGTAEWRDPWLYLRGRWDAAADRWAAAAVLYLAVTGAKLSRGETDEVIIDAERFDAAVRDQLADFFRKVFHRDPAQRFDSAEAMRQAWTHALIADDATSESASAAIDLSQVRPTTPIDALPLSVRARNALDRAGVRTAAELLQLPRNQLSVVRGVGKNVAREIIEFADLLRERLTIEPGTTFLPDFVRPRLSLDDAELALDRTVRETLTAAGLGSTVEVAQAESARIVRLLGEARAEVLRKQLKTLAAAEPVPGSLADWSRALVGRASDSEANKRLRVLVGLDPFPDGREDTSHPAARAVSEVAEAFGLEPAQLHSNLQFLRNKRWADIPTAASLVETLGGLLEAAGPVIEISELAKALATERAGTSFTPSDLQNASALIRVALELRPDPFASWRRSPPPGRGVWIASDVGSLDALAALRKVADQLATTEPLPSTETVRSALADAVAGTALAELPPDRRVNLAAQVSATAAASARLELYPRQLSATRALTLSLGALVGTGLTPDNVRQRVAARYPEAEPLPNRPELDALLSPHGLVFSVDLGEYVRPGQHAPTSMTVQLPVRASTAPQLLTPRKGPDAQRAAAFEDQLQRSLRSGHFRVVQVPAHLAPAATEALAKATDAELVSWDHAFFETIRGKAAELEVAWENVEAADRAGPSGPDWQVLEQLVGLAANDLIDRLLAARARPLLLAWPGSMARFALAGPLSSLVDRAQNGDGAAVLMIVPSYADGLAPSINNRLPVPAPLPGQRLVMPEAWLANAHRAAESA